MLVSSNCSVRKLDHRKTNIFNWMAQKYRFSHFGFAFLKCSITDFRDEWTQTSKFIWNYHHWTLNLWDSFTFVISEDNFFLFSFPQQTIQSDYLHEATSCEFSGGVVSSLATNSSTQCRELLPKHHSVSWEHSLPGTIFSEDGLLFWMCILPIRVQNPFAQGRNKHKT